MVVQVTNKAGAQRFYRQGIGNKMVPEGSMNVPHSIPSVEVEDVPNSAYLRLTKAKQPTYVLKADTNYYALAKAALAAATGAA